MRSKECVAGESISLPPITHVTYWVLHLRRAWNKKRLATEPGPRQTLCRVCTSQHLRDLQWIASITLLIILLLLIGKGLPFLINSFRTLFTGTFRDSVGLAESVSTQLHIWPFLRRLHILWEEIFAKVSATSLGGIIGAGGAILAWVYQTGSDRLGVIDLFGCEISVICRTCLIVDFAKSSTHLTEQSGFKFSSEEDYAPVYNNQLADLKPLDADVVNAVSQFYTYRKMMIDYLRGLEESAREGHFKARVTQMIYMQFLMYEAGRKAVERLVEFEPNRDENLVYIYCSEILLFGWLLKRFSESQFQTEQGGRKHEDFRLARLEARQDDYIRDVEKLYADMAKKRDLPEWNRACITSEELRYRYNIVFDKKM
jgi:hypothetical protein